MLELAIDPKYAVDLLVTGFINGRNSVASALFPYSESEKILRSMRTAAE